MRTALEVRLERAEARLGPDSFMVQQLRNQIHAQTTSKSAADLYINGGIKKEPSTKEDVDKK
jgi:hypothetical protein